MKLAEYHFPKLICTDLWDGTSVHLEECESNWFRRLDKDSKSQVEENCEAWTVFWQTAIMLEGNELAFYRLHVVFESTGEVGAYFIRYERFHGNNSGNVEEEKNETTEAPLVLTSEKTYRAQMERYKSSDVIEMHTSKDLNAIVSFLEPHVNTMRDLYLSDKNLAQFSEAVVSRAERMLKQYISLREQLHVRLECSLQFYSHNLLVALSITPTNIHFLQFVNGILKDTNNGEIQPRIATDALLSCFRRLLGYFFFQELKKRYLPSSQDLESLLHVQIWTWSSPKKPGPPYDFFTCYLLKFLYCSKPEEPFSRLHDVTQKWRAISSTVSPLSFYPEVHHPWLQLLSITALPYIAELVETAYASLVRMSLSQILQIRCVQMLVRLGISSSNISELVRDMPFCSERISREKVKPFIESPKPLPEAERKAHEEKEEESTDLEQFSSENDSEAVVVATESDDVWGSPLSSVLKFRRRNKKKRIVTFMSEKSDSASREEELTSKELQLKEKERRLAQQELELQKRFQEVEQMKLQMQNSTK